MKLIKSEMLTRVTNSTECYTWIKMADIGSWIKLDKESLIDSIEKYDESSTFSISKSSTDDILFISYI